MLRVNLLRIDTSRVRARLDAVIEQKGGDMVLEGQDFGRVLEEVWGGDEYEYWFTVDAEHRNDLLVLLIIERFGDEAGPMATWLQRRGIRATGSADGVIDAVRVGRRRRVHIRSAGGEVRVPGSEFDGLTLALVRDLFTSKRFEHSSAFSRWLSENDVPTSFFSYS